MTDLRWTMHLRRAFFVGLGLVALLACTGGSARAQEEDEETQGSFEERILKGVLGTIGLIRKPEIEYRERSPLVVPSSRDLPPPETANAKNAWPADLDTKRADHLTKRPAGKPADWKDASTNKVSEPSDLSKVFGGGGIFNKLKGPEENEIGTFTGEPPRVSLTEPPRGYKTPSATAPYGITTGGRFNKPEDSEVDPGKPATYGGSK